MTYTSNKVKTIIKSNRDKKMGRIIISSFTAILIFFSVFSIMSQKKVPEGSMAQISQQNLLAKKKVELKEKVELLNDVHKRYKYAYQKYNDARINYKGGPPQIILRLDRIETLDRSGFPIYFTRTVMLEMSGEKINKFTIKITKYRVYTNESYETRETIVDTNNLDNIKSITLKDYIERKSNFDDKDLELYVKILIVDNISNTMQEVITKLERLIGAFYFRFEEDASNQAGTIEEYIPVIK